MEEIVLSRNDRFILSSTSKGNQIKWFKDNKYIKADTMGYEGFAEALTSELFGFIETDYSYIDYFLCSIKEVHNDVATTYNGCYSNNYLEDNESFISFYRLMKGRKKDLDILLKKYNGLDLVKFVVSEIYDITGLDCRDYLGFLTRFDALILNEDRHFNNICLVYNSEYNRYSLSPVFDNGLSLLSDTSDYPLGANVNVCVRNVKSKPFSTSFSKQVRYFDADLIRINYNGFLRSLDYYSDVFDNDSYKRARYVLLSRLSNTEGKLWKRV